MPNHIDNNVLIIADDKLVKQIRDEIRGDEIDSNTGVIACIDFDKIVPMPKELENTTSPTKIVTQSEYDDYMDETAELERQVESFKDTPNEELTDDERKLRNQLCFRSNPITQEMSDDYKQRFGADNWYDWRVKNTGTKWGAYSCTNGDDDGNFFFFQTAWAHPEKLMVALSKKYPKAIFLCTFADEDTGSNCGAIAYCNGVSRYEDAQEYNDGDYAFSSAFAYATRYGDDATFNIEEDYDDEYYDDDDKSKAKKMIEIIEKAEHPLIKLALDITNPINHIFLTETLTIE